MYTYYLLSSMGPKVQKYLWWKRYLTRLQLVSYSQNNIYYLIYLHGLKFSQVQFAAVLANSLLVLHPSCGFPKTMMLGMATHMVLFFVLFFNFYMKNYINTAGKLTPGEEFAKICIPNGQLAKQD
jgi:elongation of very long chain fatty acids protein 7